MWRRRVHVGQCEAILGAEIVYGQLTCGGRHSPRLASDALVDADTRLGPVLGHQSRGAAKRGLATRTAVLPVCGL